MTVSNAIPNPRTKSDGDLLVYDDTAKKWIAQAPPDLDAQPGPANYVIYKSGSTYLARNGQTGVDDYGPDTLGTVFNQAITAVASIGTGTIGLQSGVVHTLDTPLVIPADISGRMIIDLFGSTITLSSGAKSLAVYNRTADNQTFQNVTIRNGVVDRNSIDSVAHVVLGTRNSDGSTSVRVNQTGIRIEDITTVNVPVHIGDNYNYNVALIGYQSSSNEATQTKLTDIRVSRCRFNGGNYGVAVYGAGSATVNVFVDDVHIEDCEHIMPSTPTTGVGTFDSAHFHLVSRGIGGANNSITRCYGKNSGDVGIELNTAQRINVTDCVMEDCYNYGFYHTAFRAYSNLDSATISWDGCTSRRVAMDGPPGHGFGVGDNSFPIGTVAYTNCVYEKATTGLVGDDENALFLGANVSAKEIRVDGFTANYHGWTWTGTSTGFLSAIYVSSGTGSSLIRLRNIRVAVTGTKTGSGDLQVRGFRQDGGTTVLDVDGFGMEATISTATNDQTRIIEIGGGHVRGVLRNVVPLNAMGDDTAPTAIRIGSSGSVTIDNLVTVDNLDTFKFPGGGQTLSVGSGQTGKTKTVTVA